MANPPHDSRDQIFTILDTDGASTRDLSPFLTGVDGLPGTKELLDTTKIGDSGRTFTRSLWNGSFTLEGYFDATSSNGPGIVLGNLLASDTGPFAFQYGPTGSSSDASPLNRKISGNCWIRDYNITGRVATAISFRAAGQVDGVVTEGTWT